MHFNSILKILGYPRGVNEISADARTMALGGEEGEITDTLRVPTPFSPSMASRVARSRPWRAGFAH
jgi:hypothetical protein